MPAEKPTFEQIMAEHAPFVRRTLAQLGVRARDLADVEQEVFRGVDRRLSAFDPSRSSNPQDAMRGWLFGICERQAASHRRAEMKRGELLFAVSQMEGTAATAPTVEEALIDREQKALLHRLLDSLEPARRAVVIAYELEGRSMTEIAAELSIPVNTAWNRLRLGREDLQAAWKRLSKKEGWRAPLPVLGSLFGGAEWCTGGRELNTLSGPARATTGARAGPGVGPASGGGAVPVAVAGPAHGVFFGMVGMTAAAVVAAAVVLGGAEDPRETGAEPLPEEGAKGSTETAVRSSSTGPVSLALPAANEERKAASRARGVEAAALLATGATRGGQARGAAGAAKETGDAFRAGSKAVGTAEHRGVAAGGGRDRAPAPDRLRLEYNHLQEAMAALKSGHLHAAKAALDSHARAFPKGSLAGEREMLMAQTLVAMNQAAEARDRARRFVSSNPENAFRERLEAAVSAAK